MALPPFSANPNMSRHNTIKPVATYFMILMTRARPGDTSRSWRSFGNRVQVSTRRQQVYRVARTTRRPAGRQSGADKAHERRPTLLSKSVSNAPTGGPVRGVGLVEVLCRHSNSQDLVTIMNGVLDKIKADDQTIMPGVSSTGGLDSVGASRLCEADKAALVESFRRGVRILDLASEYGVSESCVKRTLRRSGVGRRQRY